MALIDYNPHTQNDLFYYNEGATSVRNLISTLAKEICESAGATYKWTQIYPTGGSAGVTDKVILKTTTSFAKDFYLKIDRPATAPIAPATTTTIPYTYLNLTIGSVLNATLDDIPKGSDSPVAKFSWYKEPLDPSIKDWLPVNYWLNVTPDAINLVLRGDPSADVYPYNKFLLGYAYVGSLKPLEEGQDADTDYNFAVTASSATEPTYTTTYGPRTGTSITDVCMIANKIGLPFQPHYPAFYTANPSMDKMNIEGSRWNQQKHQFSDITLVHPVDMERGKMINVLSGDSSALYDNDKLVFKQNTTSQEMYRKFMVTSPFNFLNNSANVLYCLAVRCYNEDKVIQVDDGVKP
jgi:hypothetical protein